MHSILARLVLILVLDVVPASFAAFTATGHACKL